MTSCTHLDTISVLELPESVEGCEDCLREGGVWLHLQQPYPAPGSRLWRARTDPRVLTAVHLAAHGRPIGYGYLEHAADLAMLQNVYADEPGPEYEPPAGPAGAGSRSRPGASPLAASWCVSRSSRAIRPG